MRSYKTAAESNSEISQRYSHYINKVMRDNEKFLQYYAKDTSSEIIELVNDAIDNVTFWAKRGDSENDYASHSIAFFIYHILMPFSYAMYVDLIAGNIPVCFMELRLMLESLVKCYSADLRYPNQTFFQEKLELLDKKKRKISQVMKEVGEMVGFQNNFVTLWRKLSESWIHTRGISDGIVGRVVDNSNVPPWALPLPMNYSKKDLGTINELRKDLSEFRSLLAATMKKYQEVIIT